MFGPRFSHNGIPFFLHENMSWTNCHVTCIQRAMINPPSLHGAPNYIKGISAYKTRVKYASNLRLNYTVKARAKIGDSKEAEPHQGAHPKHCVSEEMQSFILQAFDTNGEDFVMCIFNEQAIFFSSHQAAPLTLR